MEGSTLGGQTIARHVERVLELNAGQGDSYFRGHGENTGRMWKEFCQVQQTRVPDRETGAVVEAAKAMFQVFGSWMRRGPGQNGTIRWPDLHEKQPPIMRTSDIT